MNVQCLFSQMGHIMAPHRGGTQTQQLPEQWGFGDCWHFLLTLRAPETNRGLQGRCSAVNRALTCLGIPLHRKAMQALESCSLVHGAVWTESQPEVIPHPQRWYRQTPGIQWLTVILDIPDLSLGSKYTRCFVSSRTSDPYPLLTASSYPPLETDPHWSFYRARGINGHFSSGHCLPDGKYGLCGGQTGLGSLSHSGITSPTPGHVRCGARLRVSSQSSSQTCLPQEPKATCVPSAPS